VKTGMYADCGICGTRFFDDEGSALACEAQGTPGTPAWLSSRVGQEVAGFGECRIETATLLGFTVQRRHGGHELLAVLDEAMVLSHNHEEVSLVPAWGLDPMHGWDFLRYVGPDDTGLPLLVVTWVTWCRRYGIEPDPTRALWWNMGERKRARFLDLLGAMTRGVVEGVRA